MQIVNPVEENGWDERLSQYQAATIFHSACWTKVLEETYGYQPCCLVEGQGLLPIMQVKSWLTGKRGISLPFTDECEPLGFDVATFRKCLEQLSDYGRSRNWKYWELRGGEPLIHRAKPSVQFYTHTLDLSLNFQLSPSALSLQPSALDGSVRRAIRKAEKSGVTTRVAQDEAAMKTFYRLQCRTRQKHGLPPQPWAFFQNLQRHVMKKGAGFLVLASRGEAALAASLFLVWGKRAIYKFGASDERLQEFRGTNLVMWQAIQHCASKGLETLDLGRTSIGNEGLRRFKLGWGAEEKTRSYYKFDLRRNDYVSDHDRAHGWHNRVFRSLPMPLLG